MNLKKTLTFAVILLGIFGYIWYIELPSEKATEEAKLLITGVEKEEIQQVVITRGSESFKLINDSRWKIDQPGYSDVDPGAINSLIAAILDFKVDSTIPTEDIEEDLTLYGLKDPLAQISFSTKGEETTLSFGKKNDYTAKRYAKSDKDNKIFLVTDELFEAIQKSKDDFRDKTPIEYADTSVAAYRLKSSKRDYEFVSDEKGNWQATKPLQVTLSPASISELARNVRNLTAQKFYDPSADKNAEKGAEKGAEKALDLKTYGLDKPLGTVEVVFKDSSVTPLTVSFSQKKIGNEENFVSVSGIPSVFSLATNPLPQIYKDLDLYREKNLFSFSTDDVNEILFENVSKEIPTLKLEKILAKGDRPEWHVDGQMGDITFIHTLINDLSGLRAESFPAESVDFGFAEPTLKVTLKLGSDSVNSKLLVVGKKVVSGKETKGYYAGVGELNEPFLISEATLTQITPKKEALIPTKDKGDTPKEE